MGKSKNNKPNIKNNIFKVAGCKSLKAKNKAKSVTADRLKQVKLEARFSVIVVHLVVRILKKSF